MMVLGVVGEEVDDCDLTRDTGVFEGGAELPSSYGHSGGGEPIVKPTSKRSVLPFERG